MKTKLLKKLRKRFVIKYRPGMDRSGITVVDWLSFPDGPDYLVERNWVFIDKQRKEILRAKSLTGFIEYMLGVGLYDRVNPKYPEFKFLDKFFRKKIKQKQDKLDSKVFKTQFEEITGKSFVNDSN